MAESVAMAYEIISKVETLKLDGQERMFAFQGRLAITTTDNEPLMLAFPVPEEVWRAHDVGDVMSFVYEGTAKLSVINGGQG